MFINNKLFVGMDLHKSTSTFCVKDYDGNVIRSQKVLTDRTQIREFFQSLGQSSSVVMEPVSQWYTYADMIENLGNEVHIAHPLKVKAIASARIKTDKIDAGVLADLLRANLLPEAYFSPKEVRGWKELTRFRASLINLRSQVKNKIHAILHKHAIIHGFSDLFGPSGIKWLKNLTLEEPFKTSLAQYLSLVEYLTAQIDAAEEKITQTVTDHPQAKLLTTIPGISFVSGLTIMAEIGEIERFPSPKQLMGYAGLTPSTYSSGDITRHGRITKTGNKWLRYIMVEVAHHQQRCKRHPAFSNYYKNLAQRRGAKTAAVATARKLLAVVWRILKDRREFSDLPPHSGKSGPLAQKISS
jgi:transposase